MLHNKVSHYTAKITTRKSTKHNCGRADLENCDIAATQNYYIFFNVKRLPDRKKKVFEVADAR